MKKFLIPLALFFGLVAFLAVGLKRDPREIPSPLVGKPAPAFSLPTLTGDQPFSPADYKGQVWLFNVWATWCVACREEHPLLVEFSKTQSVPIIGLSYKEVQAADQTNGPLSDDAKLSLARERSLRFLQRQGDPYKLSVMDLDGSVGIDYGVYGVPETYVIDREGIIRYKQVGPVTPEILETKLLPLIRQLEKS
ncbi:TrxA Thiol-disulfide isomerase and thioredoxins [Burkholderiaceae bacterium]|jgi:cytochrome c biogenesis protein CcmG/thiol:disulfide interchange protein DsbE|nr:DsbE family thiol:disulfide interchange protein [Limnohabitans sp.]MBP8020838.1 DsbE family thiol:disulfide interchange protein [Limnohabitans sp.]